MDFFANKANNRFLIQIIKDLQNNVDLTNEISEIKIAVAYGHNFFDIFDICTKHNIPLTYYCRCDSGIPVSPLMLEWFIGKEHKGMQCRLAGDYFHAKIIHFVGFGLYVGSANLTDRAWATNIEGGMFFTEDELDTFNVRSQFELFFEYISENSIAITQETVDELKARQERFKKLQKQIDDFNEKEQKNSRIPTFKNPISVNKVKRNDEQKNLFIKEWDETLQILRDIGNDVATNYRPHWIVGDVSQTAQADQFLHAYYYQIVVKDRVSTHRVLHEKNRHRKVEYLQEMMSWWKQTQKPPSTEKRQFEEWGPKVLQLTRKEKIRSLSEDDFSELLTTIHAFRNHSRQMRYTTLGINSDNIDGEEKIRLGAQWVYRQRSDFGKSPLELLEYLLYSEDGTDIAHRLWEVHRTPKWKIAHFGLSTLGELIGWALPDKFCPRNGRTNKALYALGFDVTLYSV